MHVLCAHTHFSHLVFVAFYTLLPWRFADPFYTRTIRTLACSIQASLMLLGVLRFVSSLRFLFFLFFVLFETFKRHPVVYTIVAMHVLSRRVHPNPDLYDKNVKRQLLPNISKCSIVRQAKHWCRQKVEACSDCIFSFLSCFILPWFLRSIRMCVLRKRGENGRWQRTVM